MKVVLFYHSLLSDWNHGNAHFLRGVVGELLRRGHQVKVMEPEKGWSLENLVSEYGLSPIVEFEKYYPQLNSHFYKTNTINLDNELAGADLVLVHEWNAHDLVRKIGQHRKKNNYLLLFHDTHHRVITEKENMAAYDLSHYDGILAYGEVIRQIYLKEGWAKKAWTWHEAADTSIFFPHTSEEKEGDLVWIGNWGDNERTKELHEFLLEPVQSLSLKAKVYGVRYPPSAIEALEKAGISYGGWLPNYKAPEVFAKYKLTVHVPRRPYVEALPGIPTIRPFEAMACGIPLLSAPWQDAEGLFTPGKDFLMARTGAEMKEKMAAVLASPELSISLASHGLNTIQQKHTCAHRVDALEKIYAEESMPKRTKRTVKLVP